MNRPIPETSTSGKLRILRVIDELADSSICENLDHFTIDEIAKFCIKLELVAGDSLISEYDGACFDLYILCAGNVEIVSNHSTASSGEVVLSKRDTDLFGEIGWLHRKNRTATVRCIGDVEAIRINGDKFMRYLEQRPEVGFQVMRNIAHLITERLSQTDSLLKQILWNINI